MSQRRSSTSSSRRRGNVNFEGRPTSCYHEGQISTRDACTTVRIRRWIRGRGKGSPPQGIHSPLLLEPTCEEHTWWPSTTHTHICKDNVQCVETTSICFLLYLVHTWQWGEIQRASPRAHNHCVSMGLPSNHVKHKSSNPAFEMQSFSSRSRKHVLIGHVQTTIFFQCRAPKVYLVLLFLATIRHRG